MSQTSKLYLEWLQRGLDKPGKHGKELAAVLGVSESVVSRMRAGLRRIHAVELQKIANYIDEEIPTEQRLVTPTGRPLAHTALGGAQAVPLVRVTAVIAPSVWREVGATLAIAERIPASPDPRLSGMKQYACKIEAEGNRYAICVPYGDMRTKPMANDLVHVRRTSKGFHEDTLRVVRVSPGVVQLALEGASRDKESVLTMPSTKPHETIEIKGLVVGYFSPTSF